MSKPYSLTSAASSQAQLIKPTTVNRPQFFKHTSSINAPGNMDPAKRRKVLLEKLLLITGDVEKSWSKMLVNQSLN
jgi:hypothetical protein